MNMKDSDESGLAMEPSVKHILFYQPQDVDSYGCLPELFAVPVSFDDKGGVIDLPVKYTNIHIDEGTPTKKQLLALTLLQDDGKGSVGFHELFSPKMERDYWKFEEGDLVYFGMGNIATCLGIYGITEGVRGYNLVALPT